MADAKYRPACGSWGRNLNNPMSWRPLFPGRSSRRSSCCPSSESDKPQTMDNSMKESPFRFGSRTGLPSSAADLSSGDSLQCDWFSGTQCSHAQAWEPARGKRHCSPIYGLGSEIETSLTWDRFLRISFFTVLTLIDRTCEGEQRSDNQMQIADTGRKWKHRNVRRQCQACCICASRTSMEKCTEIFIYYKKLVCIYTYLYMHTFTFTYIHTYIHTYIRYVRTYIYLHIYIYIYVNKYIYMYI